MMQTKLQTRQELLLEERREQEKQEKQKKQEEAEEERNQVEMARRRQRLQEPLIFSSEDLLDQKEKIEQMVQQMDEITEFEKQQVRAMNSPCMSMLKASGNRTVEKRFPCTFLSSTKNHDAVCRPTQEMGQHPAEGDRDKDDHLSLIDGDGHPRYSTRDASSLDAAEVSSCLLLNL